ncbi:prepilin peptidase [Methylobacillus sp. Pita2]|uniref:prepilin peptidase n=1 Tax=Methylobacillus sp. Pita2 TaxID=3383245 RepID=UPI0038B457BF
MILGWLEWSAIVFFSGICIGSFLNVVIYRLPIMLGIKQPPRDTPAGQTFSLSFPASHCPHCHHKIRWFENIPLISYIALRGKCRTCKVGIPFRYFLVELVTGLVFLGIWVLLTR